MKEKRQKSKMLEWALVYAREGWRVHPVCWVKDGTCQYHKNCTRSGKVPLIKWGSDEPSTTDEKTIRKWWAQWPDANIGVATGEVSGFIVLDADGEKGNQSLQALEDEYGPLPKTPEVLTGGGGWHLWFKWPGFHTKNSAQAVAPRLDIRADGGQVVVPPSLHVSGNNYEWDGDSKHPKREELAECPQWLV
jgi:putative DNA primase/helicase